MQITSSINDTIKGSAVINHNSNPHLHKAKQCFSSFLARNAVSKFKSSIKPRKLSTEEF
jgi:hypothetical protein